VFGFARERDDCGHTSRARTKGDNRLFYTSAGGERQPAAVREDRWRSLLDQFLNQTQVGNEDQEDRNERDGYPQTLHEMSSYYKTAVLVNEKECSFIESVPPY
jgi:hypothetical protein